VIKYSELTEVKAIAEGGFGVVNLAEHLHLGKIIYKELKSSIIPDNSKCVYDYCLFAMSGFTILF